MANSIQLQEGPSKSLKYLFDLKGSLVNRQTMNPKPSSTLKDVNLLQIKVEENILKFT